jgi:hypothetical protein
MQLLQAGCIFGLVRESQILTALFQCEIESHFCDCPRSRDTYMCDSIYICVE